MPEEPFSRRLLLGSAAALLLAGCEGDRPSEPTPSRGSSSDSPGPPSGDELLVARALRSAARLAAAYTAVEDRHPQARSLTRPLRGHLREHLTAFGGAEPAKPSPAARSLPIAVGRLLADERAASRARAADAEAAESGDLARTLASVAGSHAQHVVVLQQFLAAR